MTRRLATTCAVLAAWFAAAIAVVAYRTHEANTRNRNARRNR